MQTTFANLLEPTIGAAYRSALRFTHNEADAEELVQEAGMLAFQHFDSYQEGTNFKAWFLAIVKNCFLTAWRKQRRQPQSVDLSELPDTCLYDHVLPSDLYSKVEDPANILLQDSVLEQITCALQRMPKEYQDVSTSYFVDELSYQEISAQLGIPIGTVRSRLHRGRKVLQTLLYPSLQDAGGTRPCREAL